VLAAAVDLLVERGAAGTTIEAVAARSGVAKTTIYRQWDDQGALVLDAFAILLAAPEAPDTGSLRDDLATLLAGLAGALSTGPAAALMPELIAAAERDPAFAALHRRETEARHRAVRDVLARGVERGELPGDADLDLLVDLLAGPLFHRRWFTGTPATPAFAAAILDTVLGSPQHTTSG
jgi:AcrR family transcriptional regulator